jgi:hypothetical protein
VEPADLDLLRRYEPILRYTHGELFLPIAVDDYVARCSLWDERDVPLVPAGELSLEALSEQGRRRREHRMHLRFVQKSLRAKEVRRWRRTERPRVGGIGRFAAVGVIARLIDVVLRLSLLVRGKVPNGLVAAAHQRSKDLQGATYYCRVVRSAGYTVLQYWYFYAFNDWRSTFHGVNDHEADWETVSVYLAPGPDGELAPAWVAGSSHDHTGDDLRRRWDDPLLDKDGEHPVLYPGAGSHSHAFVAGDYVVSVGLPALRAVLRTIQRMRRWLMPFAPAPGSGSFDIPFIDYARGDGLSLETWTRVPVDDTTPWLRDFRGLWGLDTKDSFGGERAPAGPRYERDGSVRRSWADPLGWAGLDKVPATADEEVASLEERMKLLQVRVDELETEIDGERTAVRGLYSEIRYLTDRTDAAPDRPAHLEELRTRETALADLVAERVRLVEEIDVQADRLARPRPPGGRPPPPPAPALRGARGLPLALPAHLGGAVHPGAHRRPRRAALLAPPDDAAVVHDRPRRLRGGGVRGPQALHRVRRQPGGPRDHGAGDHGSGDRPAERLEDRPRRLAGPGRPDPAGGQRPRAPRPLSRCMIMLCVPPVRPTA